MDELSLYKINIVPLSINQAYKGRRFSTDQHKKYKDLLRIHFLKMKVPQIDPKERINLYLEFGTTDRQDLSNSIKCFEDCLCDHLGINDRKVESIYARKKIVKEKDRYIIFGIYRTKEELIQSISEKE